MRFRARKFLSLIDREIKGVHQAALLLGIMGILTKILALIRDRILAAQFGAGRELDIYFAAFRIPDFIFTLSLFVTAGSSLIPAFLKEISKGKNEAKIFLGKITFIFSIFIFFLSVVSFFLAPYLVRFIAPGFNNEEILFLTTLTRLMLFSPILLGFSNIISIIIQSFQKFFVYSLSPLVYNIGIIIGIIEFYPRIGNIGLALSVVLGATFHLIVQIPSLLKSGIFPKFSFPIFTAEIKKTFANGFVRTAGISLNQLVLIILIAFASFFGAGSIAVFNFANNLQSIPLSVVGLSYSIAAFPALSRFAVNGSRKEFLEHISVALRHIIFWSIPISAAFIVLRAQIVRSVLGAGNFGWAETRLTAASLAIFSVSIVAQSLILLFSRAYYAAEITKRPIIINIFSSILIILMSFVFVFFLSHDYFYKYFISVFRVKGLENIRVLSLPAAYSFGSLVNVFLLWKFFVKDFGVINGEVMKSLKENLISGVVFGAVSYFGLQIFSRVFNLSTFFGIFFQGFFAGVLGFVSAFFVLYLFKNKELLEITYSLKTKFWKTKIIGEERDPFV